MTPMPVWAVISISGFELVLDSWYPDDTNIVLEDTVLELEIRGLIFSVKIRVFSMVQSRQVQIMSRVRAHWSDHE